MDDVNQLFSRLEGEEWPPVGAGGSDLRNASDARHRRRTTLAVGATTAAVVAVLVGSQLPNHAASPRVVPGGSPAPQSTAYAPATPIVAPTPSVPAPAAVQRCTVASLTARIYPGSPGAGQRYAEIWLTNTSGRACSILGFGGARFEGLASIIRPSPTPSPNLSMTSFGTVFVRSSAKPTRVVLRPGDIASSLLHWNAFDDRGDCAEDPTFIFVTPPDERSSIRAGWPAGGVCAHAQIDQEPYVAGRGK